MTVVSMVFAASTASANFEFTEEGGAHCPEVTEHGPQVGDIEGGCLMHGASEPTKKTELRKHVFGIESHITACDTEGYGRVNEVGEGWIFEQFIGGTGCTRQACIKPHTGQKEHWKAHAREGTASPEGKQPFPEGREAMHLVFCVEPISPNGEAANETCELQIPFQSYENQHRTEGGHATEVEGTGVAGFRCELVGHWNTEQELTPHGQTQEVMITHANETL